MGFISDNIWVCVWAVCFDSNDGNTQKFDGTQNLVQVNWDASNLNESHELSEHISLSIEDLPITISHQLDDVGCVAEFHEIVPLLSLGKAFVIVQGLGLFQVWVLHHEEGQEHRQMHN